MPLYFLVHDARRFHEDIAPALAASGRQRSFRPCQALCRALAPEAAAFQARYFAGTAEPLLGQVARGLPFDRDFWRLLVGEVLLYAAVEVPEFQTAPDSLLYLLAPERSQQGPVPREQFVPIEQAHFGTRDLVFGNAYYQPERTGLNNPADVARLAAYLAAVDPSRWTAADLDGLRGLEMSEDREEELEFVREVFPVLGEMYQRAEQRAQIIICDLL
jgi:hypothetical protein